MANYLRDSIVNNLSIDEDALNEICGKFEILCSKVNASGSEKAPICFYTIRFDKKGYIVYSCNDLLQYFRQAKEVTRIIFKLETKDSLESKRETGTYIELLLGEKNPCNLVVTSDDKDWVDDSFLGLQEILTKYKNRNGWMRTSWTLFGVQIIGVTIGFCICLWAAIKLAPMLVIQDAFVICFFFLILVFSNAWTYLNKITLNLIDKAFPNMKFCRAKKDYRHWVPKLIVNTIVGALILWGVVLIFSSIGHIAIGFINKGSI